MVDVASHWNMSKPSAFCSRHLMNLPSSLIARALLRLTLSADISLVSLLGTTSGPGETAWHWHTRVAWASPERFGTDWPPKVSWKDDIMKTCSFMFFYVLLCSFVLSGKMWFSGWDWGGYHCVSYFTFLNERWRHGKEPKLPAIPRSHVLCAEDQAVFGHQGLGGPLLRHIGSIVREGFQAKAHLQHGTVWHGMARYGTVKLRNLRCLGRPLFSVPRCTILYHVVMHVVTFQRFETC